MNAPTPAPPPGVNEKKRLVARALLAQAGNLVEFWGEMGDSEVDAEFARACLARWMRPLPGGDWDIRLGDPDAA
ncbi:hypothetical protein HUT19_41230 (plasmid) [Streptomyces sp. NA02950]|uniref:hypothetical protein n=1 Tax=Streptomyces sp. NA02950 TaxID=2742137 RepID=UPI0015919C9E|nr:hypothetical protein [Streptomyces sp. NA02950]QKV98147.1 hypothetical protein HUT19_41230 [Streptomyces sp. NA02950]